MVSREFFWGDFCDWYLELIKPRMKEDSGRVARQVLATVLDQVLRLFHPFIPFITEAIWESLNERASVRGISVEKNRNQLRDAQTQIRLVDENIKALG